jgi:glycerol-3-phosphate acyltransferase PlsY
MKVLLLSVVSYFIGGIPTGYIIFWVAKKEDIRNLGSGNFGFSNVVRAAGPLLGALVLIIDAGKAFTITYYFSSFFENPNFYKLLFGLIAILGNIFTPFLKFKGGKGVAAGLGVALAISPYAVGISLIVFTLTVFLSRYFSLGSLAAAFVFLISNILFFLFSGNDIYVVVFSVLLFLAIVIRHISNIKRLINGEENKIGKKK